MSYEDIITAFGLALLLALLSGEATVAVDIEIQLEVATGVSWSETPSGDPLEVEVDPDP